LEFEPCVKSTGWASHLAREGECAKETGYEFCARESHLRAIRDDLWKRRPASRRLIDRRYRRRQIQM